MYCKNCGEELKLGYKYCTICGYNNEIKKENKDDKPSFWLGLLGFIIPILGIILSICFHKENPKKAKSLLIGSLIKYALRIIIIINFIIVGITYLFSNNDFNIEEKIKDYENYFEEYYYEYADEDKYEFSGIINYYARLAEGKFYKDIYEDNSIKEKCYSLSDIEENNDYKGSIEVKLENNQIKMTIWLTDYEYYVDGVDYDTYSIKDMKRGANINLYCTNDEVNNTI